MEKSLSREEVLWSINLNHEVLCSYNDIREDEAMLVYRDLILDLATPQELLKLEENMVLELVLLLRWALRSVLLEVRPYLSKNRLAISDQQTLVPNSEQAFVENDRVESQGSEIFDGIALESGNHLIREWLN